MRALLIAFATLGVASSAGRAQDIKSPAELIPAKVIVYGEIRQPGPLAQEVARLVEGSALGNVPDSLHKIRSKFEKALGTQRFEGMGVAGLIFSPEIVKEMGRVQGAGFAVTGMTPQGEPQFLATILPGQSNAPGFVMRTFLAMERVRQVELVEGVAIYRAYSAPFAVIRPAIKDGGKFEEVQPLVQIREYGPYYVNTPGLIAIGSADLVKDAIRRSKGKLKEPSFAADANFQQASKDVDSKPGLFAYLSGTYLTETFKGLPIGPAESSILGMARIWKNLVVQVGLEQGTFTYRDVSTFDPQLKQQVLDLMPTKAIDANLLNYAPRDAILAGVVSNTDGEKRWNKLLALIDQSFPAIQGKKPSEHLQDVETAIGVNVGKDILGPVTNAGFALGDPTRATVRRVEEKGPNFHRVSTSIEVPFVTLLQAADEKGAKGLIAVVPKLMNLVNRGQGEASTETIGGLEIHTLKVGGRPVLSYGTHERMVVIGPYAGPVAMALLNGSKQKGLLADANVSARVKSQEGALLVFLMKPIGVVAGGLLTTVSRSEIITVDKAVAPKDFKKEEEKKFEEKKFEEKKFDAKNVEEKQEVRQEQGNTRTEVVNPPGSPVEERFKKEFGQVLADEDWFLLTVTQKDGKLIADGKVSNLDKVVGRLIDFGIEETFRASAEREERRIGIGPGGGTQVFAVNDRVTRIDPPDRVRQNCPHKSYVVKLEAGKTYVIDLVSNLNENFDNYLRLEDANGNQLAQDDDSGGNLNARIVFRPMRDDNYRVIATSFGGAVGSYTLTIRKRDEK